jgi:hypothetical protein
MKKNVFLYICLLLNLIMFFTACKSDKKQADLIVIDKMVYSGFDTKYYIGFDSFVTFQQIKKNGYELPYDIDSEYVFIIEKEEFDTLLNNILSKQPDYANWDSIITTNPPITYAHIYDEDTCNTIPYLKNDFQNAMPRLWIKDAGRLGKEGNRLIDRLRYHAFIK